MLDFNDKILFTRYSNVVVDSWRSGRPEIFPIESPAYLQVAVTGITAGSLYVYGTDINGSAVAETFTFTGASTVVSSYQFRTVAGLTPSWSSYTIDVDAVDSQGAPVNRSINYGPYLCSVTTPNSYTIEGRTGTPGWLKGISWRISVVGFKPLNGDFALTGKGISGSVADVQPIEIPNFPAGYWFQLQENPG
jgi:hypothetical protein